MKSKKGNNNMYANKFEKKEKQNLIEKTKLQQILALSTPRLEPLNIKNLGKIKSMFANIIYPW